MKRYGQTAEKTNYMNLMPYLKSKHIRNIAEISGCHMYTDTSGVTVYGDNRFIGIFPQDTYTGGIRFKESKNVRDVLHNVTYTEADEIKVNLSKCDAGFLFRKVKCV